MSRPRLRDLLPPHLVSRLSRGSPLRLPSVDRFEAGPAAGRRLGLHRAHREASGPGARGGGAGDPHHPRGLSAGDREHQRLGRKHRQLRRGCRLRGVSWRRRRGQGQPLRRGDPPIVSRSRRPRVEAADLAGRPLGARVGGCTWEGDRRRQYMVAGRSVQALARLEQRTPPGAIGVSPAARRARQAEAPPRRGRRFAAQPPAPGPPPLRGPPPSPPPRSLPGFVPAGGHGLPGDTGKRSRPPPALLRDPDRLPRCPPRHASQSRPVGRGDQVARRLRRPGSIGARHRERGGLRGRSQGATATGVRLPGGGSTPESWPTSGWGSTGGHSS